MKKSIIYAILSVLFSSLAILWIVWSMLDINHAVETIRHFARNNTDLIWLCTFFFFIFIGVLFMLLLDYAVKEEWRAETIRLNKQKHGIHIF